MISFVLPAFSRDVESVRGQERQRDQQLSVREVDKHRAKGMQAGAEVPEEVAQLVAEESRNQVEIVVFQTEHRVVDGGYKFVDIGFRGLRC